MFLGGACKYAPSTTPPITCGDEVLVVRRFIFLPFCICCWAMALRITWSSLVGGMLVGASSILLLLFCLIICIPSPRCPPPQRVLRPRACPPLAEPPQLQVPLVVQDVEAPSDTSQQLASPVTPKVGRSVGWEGPGRQGGTRQASLCTQAGGYTHGLPWHACTGRMFCQGRAGRQGPSPYT